MLFYFAYEVLTLAGEIKNYKELLRKVTIAVVVAIDIIIIATIASYYAGVTATVVGIGNAQLLIEELSNVLFEVP